jgi:hypothetical protein
VSPAGPAPMITTRSPVLSCVTVLGSLTLFPQLSPDSHRRGYGIGEVACYLSSRPCDDEQNQQWQRHEQRLPVGWVAGALRDPQKEQRRDANVASEYAAGNAKLAP